MFSAREVLNGRALPGAAVVVRGRLLLGAEAHVRDWTGELAVEPSGPLPPHGSIVRVEGTWSGKRIERGEVHLIQEPERSFDGAEHEAVYSRRKALRLRHVARSAVRRFFDERDFLEVETPLMVPSPGLDLHLDAFEVSGAGSPRWLITSPEYQMKRLLAGGVPAIYQLARCFRRAEQGSRHEPEFTMCEWYRGFAGSVDVMQDTEELVAFVAVETLGGTRLPSGVDVKPPWPRRSVREVFQRHAGVDAFELLADEDVFFRVFVDEVEPRFGSEAFFLTGWPASMASLARLDPADPSVADRFEAYVGGVEICNGFGELVDAAEQRRRLVRDRDARKRKGLPPYPIDERFLGALEEGIPPSGGNALGFDRLVMLLSGAEAIQEVVAIPGQRL